MSELKKFSINEVSPLENDQRTVKFRKVILVFAVAIIISIALGIVIGYFIPRGCPQKPLNSTRTQASRSSGSKDEQHLSFLNSIDAEKLEDNVRYFSKEPHIIASERQKKLADELKRRWKEEYGFDKVEMPKYNVLMSFPDKQNPNQVILFDNSTGNGTELFRISETEQIAEPSEKNPNVVLPVLGYTPSGTVEGELVYVNYGRVEDFEILKRNLSVSVTGRIAIMRYGKIYRGDKVKNAATYGAIGALIYSDPADYALEGTDANNTYPNAPWLPSTGVQRGSTFKGNGDPLTPGIPSLDGLYRLELNESGLPSIPAHPISYGNAFYLLQNMSGPNPPDGWKGNLNIRYRVGPGHYPVNNSLLVRMDIHNKYVTNDIYNVIGTIYGEEEPDRYVLMGNHRDSWVFGAVDAVSGTSSTNEIARGLGELKKKGWRPRRTIKICSWGGEEPALIGSVEWVEQNAKILSERAVVYINIDIAVMGNFVMRSSSSPLIRNSILSWTKKIKDPNAHDDKETVSDIMLERNPLRLGTNEPFIGNLGSGSDYAGFYQHIGVPSVDFSYYFGHNNKSLIYPVYHSQHDTYNWVKKFADPEFLFHKAMTQFGGGLLLDYADSPLLPMSVSRYADSLNQSFAQLQKQHSSTLKSRNISLDVLERAINTFRDAAKDFESRKSTIKPDAKFHILRQFNDQMIQLERAFINPYGLPGRRLVRHVIFAPGLHNTYGSASFPGVTDILFDVKKTGNWAEVKKQISIVVTSILSAAELLAPMS